MNHFQLNPDLTRRALLAAAALTLPVAAGLSGCTRVSEARSMLDRLPAGEPGDGPRAGADLAVQLARGLWSGPANLVFSPLSIQLALSMVRNGAAGATAAELDDLLGIDDLTAYNSELNSLAQLIESRAGTFAGEKQVGVELANSVWAQDTIGWAEPFLDALAQYYGTGVNLVDFTDPSRAVAVINDWTEEHTDGQIDQIVTTDLVTEVTKMVLVNAMSITADWQVPLTSVHGAAPFTTGGGEPIETTMLAGTTTSWWSDDVCEATRITCVGNELALAVVRPRTTVSDVLDHWADRGLSELLTGWQDSQVQLQLPAWEQEWRGSLVDLLAGLGVRTAFTHAADFSAMTADEELLIGFVEHRAVLGVDRHGLTAAAATAVGMEPTSAQVPDRSQELILDRDFIHVLHDQSTGAVLFLGVVDDPR